MIYSITTVQSEEDGGRQIELGVFPLNRRKRLVC